MAKLPRDTITHYEHDGKGNINITITDLIRCKDCEWWDSESKEKYRVCYNNTSSWEASDFCSYGKLRGEISE